MTDTTEQTADTTDTTDTTDSAAPVPGNPCWLEFYTTQTEDSVAFYRELLGWEVRDVGPGHGVSTVAIRDGYPLASFETPDEEGGTGDLRGWLVSLAVEDVEETLVRVEKEGGRILVPFYRVNPALSYALVADPNGVPVSMIADKEGQAPNPGGPGLPVWRELLVADPQRGERFYREVFGWRTHQLEVDGAAQPFWTNGRGTDAMCGIGDAAFFGDGAAPAAWRVYFGVSDVEEAVARVRELGGTVVAEPEDTPWGRIAEVRDPQGARFLLCQ